MLTLYMSPGSSSMAVHIALHEIGVPFERRSLSFARNEHKTPEYLALNPEGKVPTLLIDGRPLTEVAAILFYLAHQYPTAGLLPEGGLETEAQVISWMSFIAATIHPARRMGMERWKTVFAIAEQRLGEHAWAVDRYSIADIHLFRLYWRYATGPDADRSLFPHLTGHFDRMMQRPAVRKTCEIEAGIGYNLPA